MKNKKHAYLILSHNNFSQLAVLLRLLDYQDNDIYIHVDKKSKDVPFDLLRNTVEKSNLQFTNRVNVHWGGFSQIKAELVLLRSAIQGKYQYYHLISGADMPLHSQEYIHRYFDENDGMEFIRTDDITNEDNPYVVDRLRTYHFFRELKGRGNSKSFWARVERKSLSLQKKMNVNRTKSFHQFYFGENWFSITHDLADYIVRNERQIRKYMRFTTCCDEIFAQTLTMMSPYKDNVAGHSARLIDWHRGRPYVFREQDFEQLIHSEKLFARKFDINVDKEIITKLERHVANDE